MLYANDIYHGRACKTLLRINFKDRQKVRGARRKTINERENAKIN